LTLSTAARGGAILAVVRGAGAFVAAILVAGCGSTGGAGSPSPSPSPAPPGPPPPASPGGPTITIGTYAPSPNGGADDAAPGVGLGARASATWAAWADEADTWRPLPPASEGVYAFPSAPRWSVAIACASSDGASSELLLYRRTSATASLDVTLASFCAPDAANEDGVLHGTLTNLPATTGWLDFGYARDWRGTALPITGTSAAYEIVNVAEGAWDLGFAVRDDAAGPFTRMVLRRGEVLALDETIDVDVNGPGSFVPGTKALSLHAIADDETPKLAIYYAMGGGAYGVDVAPQDFAAGPDVSTAYATVPPEAQAAADRYRATLEALAGSDRPTRRRSVTFAIHAATDVDVTFPPALAPPSASVVATAPYLRTSTTFAPYAGAARYEVLAVAQGPRRETHEWRTSMDAAWVAAAQAGAGAGAISDTTPDLSALPGFEPSWAIAGDTPAKIDVTAFEPAQPLGDGALARASMSSTSVSP
jgi:hypothetical protein